MRRLATLAALAAASAISMAASAGERTVTLAVASPVNAKRPGLTHNAVSGASEVENKRLSATFRGLAIDPIRRYFTVMSETLRRVATVLLALTLVVGLVPHGMSAADAGVKMAMAADGDMPMSGTCDGCGDDQKAMTAGACSAFCGSFVALPSTGTVAEPASAEAFEGAAVPPIAGLAVPPDPYPPRPAVLS